MLPSDEPGVGLSAAWDDAIEKGKCCPRCLIESERTPCKSDNCPMLSSKEPAMPGKCSRLTCMCDDIYKKSGACFYWEPDATEAAPVNTKTSGFEQDECHHCKGRLGDCWRSDCLYAVTAPEDHPPGPMKPRHRPPLGDSMVVLPKHYSRFEIEPARFSVTNKMDGLEFNIIKYVARAPYKHNDNGKQDYMKAVRSIIMKAKWELGDPGWWEPCKTAVMDLLEQELSYAG